MSQCVALDTTKWKEHQSDTIWNMSFKKQPTRETSKELVGRIANLCPSGLHFADVLVWRPLSGVRAQRQNAARLHNSFHYTLGDTDLPSSAVLADVWKGKR
eukprot:2620632-Amphidinium_carterae.1